MDSSVRKDEVDLLDASVKLVRFMISNLVWLIVFPVTGLTIGYLKGLSDMKDFEARMMVRTKLMEGEEASFILRSYERTGLPGLTKEERREIEDFTQKIYTKDKSVFAVISCTSGDSTIFQKLENGILTQLNQEQLVQDYFNASKEQNKRMIESYTASIRRMETSTTQKEDSLGNSEIVGLIAKRAEFEKALSEPSIFKLVAGFKPVPAKVSLVGTSLKGFVVSLLLCFIFLFVKFFAAYYKRVNATLS